jgi:hypothetical protein
VRNPIRRGAARATDAFPLPAGTDPSTVHRRSSVRAAEPPRRAESPPELPGVGCPARVSPATDKTLPPGGRNTAGARRARHPGVMPQIPESGATDTIVGRGRRRGPRTRAPLAPGAAARAPPRTEARTVRGGRAA